MIALQIAMGFQALALGLLVVFGSARFWEICLLAVVLGLNNAFENSARQAFVREMVGKDELRNAITLNSVTVNAARAVGPAIGGVLIATVGIGVCFLLNAASFAAVVTSLLIMDRSALRPSPPSGRAGGQLREGLRYAARTPTIAVPLAMMGLVGLFAYEFSVSLPVFAERSFHGGAEAYGFLTAAMGIGAVIGGLFTAARGRTGLRPMIIASVGFGAAILVCAFAPFLGLAYAARSAVDGRHIGVAVTHRRLDVIEPAELARAQFDRVGTDVLLDPFGPACPGDRDDVAALREQPGQRDLSGSGADLGGNLLDHLDDAPVRPEVVPREAGAVATEVGFVELVGRADAPGEEAATQRGIRYEADPELAYERQDLGLGVSGPQRVLGLQSRHRTYRMRPADGLRRRF